MRIKLRAHTTGRDMWFRGGAGAFRTSGRTNRILSVRLPPSRVTPFFSFPLKQSSMPIAPAGEEVAVGDIRRIDFSSSTNVKFLTGAKSNQMKEKLSQFPSPERIG